MIVLSCYQARTIIDARKDGKPRVVTSTDLNLTEVEVELRPEGILFSNGESLGWDSLEEICTNGTACYRLIGNSLAVIQSFSELTGRFYSLMPTTLAPTLLVLGIPMHRIKDTDPYHDTLEKIKAISPIGGHVLDTTTGLGYTAIEAAKTALDVITIEIDPAAQVVAQQNPWSQALFNNAKINQIIGDSAEVVEQFNDAAFSCIIHDPPMFTLAGDLYSGAFYQQTLRILKPNGRMFHYIGDPESKTGARVTRGVKCRLQDAGFRRIQPAPRAFGLVCYK